MDEIIKRKVKNKYIFISLNLTYSHVLSEIVTL